MQPPPLIRIRDAVLSGAIAGVGGGLVFATAHAFIIVPIWTRMFGGLAGASVVGAILGWSYAELTGGEPRPVLHEAARGALFGGLLWLAVAPVTLVDAALRATTPPHTEYVEVAIAVGLALLTGGLWGWLRTRRWRGTLAGAAGTIALTMAMGGPVPIAKSVWALGIFVAVLPASIAAGALMGATLAFMRRRVPVMAQ